MKILKLVKKLKKFKVLVVIINKDLFLNIIVIKFNNVIIAKN